MYTKGTPEYNLLEKLYELRKNYPMDFLSIVEEKGIYLEKLHTTIESAGTLLVNGHLKQVERDGRVAIWITDKGFADWPAIKVVDPPLPPRPVDLLKARAKELQQKLRDGTITAAEKAEYTELLLKVIVIW